MIGKVNRDKTTTFRERMQDSMIQAHARTEIYWNKRAELKNLILNDETKA